MTQGSRTVCNTILLPTRAKDGHGRPSQVSSYVVLHKRSFSHKSHNAPVLLPPTTYHHSEQNCVNLCSEWCGVGYGTRGQAHCVICEHHNVVIMSAMASQITSLTTVSSSVYSGADQRKHQSSASLAFVRGIHGWPVPPPPPPPPPPHTHTHTNTHKRKSNKKGFIIDIINRDHFKCYKGSSEWFLLILQNKHMDQSSSFLYMLHMLDACGRDCPNTTAGRDSGFWHCLLFVTWGGVLFLTQAWVLLNWKSTQLDILIFW